MRDGTRLAVDVFKPHDIKGAAPVLLMFARYHRAVWDNGHITSAIDNSWLPSLLSKGYVVVVADVRGTGASFGTWDGPFAPVEATDGYDMVEWIAAQSWCDKNVGMFGRSYSGTLQYLTASQAPPHLKAIFPEMGCFDLYSSVLRNGIDRLDFIVGWSAHARDLDVSRKSARVDADRTDGALQAAALVDHLSNRYPLELTAHPALRDSPDVQGSGRPYLDRSPSSRVQQLRSAAIPTYVWTGWKDGWLLEALTAYRNLPQPKRLRIGPWDHGDYAREESAKVHLSWYDTWLKNRPPSNADAGVSYYTTISGGGGRWDTSVDWPPPGTVRQSYFLSADQPRLKAGIREGRLQTDALSESRTVEYVVDLRTTSGWRTRWTAMYAESCRYPDMASNDTRALTFTTAPLAGDLQITGHPLVNLVAVSPGANAQVFAYLEDVAPDGVSTYITEGALSIDHYRTAEAPYDALGLPYHPSTSRSVGPPPQGRVVLQFDLLPLSHVFRAGHRLRLAITSADYHNATAYVAPEPPRVLRFACGSDNSSLVLPVMPSRP